MPVARLLASISSQELTEWQAFYCVEPFGEERADVRSAIVAATVANVNRSSKSAPAPVTAFMPRFEAESDEDRVARLLAKRDVLAVVMGLRGTKVD